MPALLWAEVSATPTACASATSQRPATLLAVHRTATTTTAVRPRRRDMVLSRQPRSRRWRRRGTLSYTRSNMRRGGSVPTRRRGALLCCYCGW